MNHNDQMPVDEKLDQLYLQRKQQQTMPANMAQNIHLYAQQQHSANKKPQWLRPPIWASTFAACFVIVISVYFMPQQPLLDTEVAYSPALVLPDAQQSKPVKTELSNNQVASQPTMRAMSAPAAPKMKEQNTSAQESAIASSPIVTSASPEIDRAAQMAKQQVIVLQDEFKRSKQRSDRALAGQAHQSTMQSNKSDRLQQQATQYDLPQTADADEIFETIEVSGARISAFSAKTVQLQAIDSKTQKHLSSPMSAADCLGETVLIEQKWLVDINVNDWLTITYDQTGAVVQVDKLNDKLGCANDH